MYDPRTMEFNLFLPQMRLSFDQLVARARAAEAAGFVGMTGMDHLMPPLADEQPMFEAIVTTTWLAAHTDTLKLGSLVLCDAFRLPALLARQAVSIDHASGGRFELGIGAGSVPDEFPVFGVGPIEPGERVARLRETLEVIRALWAGEVVDFDGRYHQLHAARQVPAPLGPIPIVIGAKGPKMLALVREFADWWNVDVSGLRRLEEMRAQVGDARPSIQQMVAFVPSGADREAIVARTQQRFAWSHPAIGSASELVDHYGRLADQGIERVYTWFCDFAPPETLSEFGADVIAVLQTR
jgi:alkanesulfonate monooxygenase SsuD/methylene tetrahydromethanopterin reductase-like flavin-dependent oxidoreductase (luciferase family)